MVNELAVAADNKQLSRVVGRYARLDRLCLDEDGYVALDPRGAELLFQIITAREERASLACASNAPFSEWGATFTDPRLASAVVDRLTFKRPHHPDQHHFLPTPRRPQEGSRQPLILEASLTRAGEQAHQRWAKSSQHSGAKWACHSHTIVKTTSPWPEGVVPYRRLRRFATERCGYRPSTGRRAGAEAELQVDFGHVGYLLDPATGRRRKVYALLFTAVLPRHISVWLTFS